jgi:membrane protease YdiL (CAAX protease family)
MAEAAGASKGLIRPLVEVGLAAAMMVVFALMADRGPSWSLVSLACLVCVAVAVQDGTSRASSPAALLGFARPSPKVLACTAAGFLVGAGGAIAYRTHLGLGPLPAAGLEPFVAVACLIGATEELLYRGYVQGRLAVLGWPAAVVLAALAHTAYKAALFAAPAATGEIDFAFISVWTFVGGIVFGMLRQGSGSVLPPVAAHAAFDLLVYGAAAQAQWWVWT